VPRPQVLSQTLATRSSRPTRRARIPSPLNTDAARPYAVALARRIGSGALTCFWEAVLGLRWFRDRTVCDALARDHGISRATACRCRDAMTAVLAEQAPDLHQALRLAQDGGFANVILDGKIIPCAPRLVSPDHTRTT
jgi:hypothetical protein